MTRTFVHSRLASPLGTLHVITDKDRLVSLDFEDFEPRMMRLLQRRFPGAALVQGSTPAGIASALNAYFAGNMGALDAIELNMGGTAFQQAVWTALRRIPAGETQGYGALAKLLARPTASRAVGMANGSNPIAIIVPCHRVIGANGALTGYAGGLDRKKFLLSHEGARFRA